MMFPLLSTGLLCNKCTSLCCIGTAREAKKRQTPLRQALVFTESPGRRVCDLLESRLARGLLLESRLASLAKRKTDRNSLAKRKTSRQFLAKRNSECTALAKRKTDRTSLAKRKTSRRSLAKRDSDRGLPRQTQNRQKPGGRPVKTRALRGLSQCAWEIAPRDSHTLPYTMK